MISLSNEKERKLSLSSPEPSVSFGHVVDETEDPGHTKKLKRFFSG